MVHLEQQRYFLDRLDNPRWLRPLWKKGFFSTPPEPRPDPERGAIEYRQWPAARYLSRMAALDPETVAEILLSVPHSDNPFIVRDFLEAAIAMPVPIAAKLSTTISKLVKTPFLIQATLAGEFATHLARGGEHTAAITVLGAALEVIPDPRPVPEPLKKFDPDYKYEARARLMAYEYGLILQRHTTELTRLLGLPFLSLLCDLLDRALKLEIRRTPNTGRIEDYSYIWRRNLAVGERGDSIKNLLASAVLSSADILCIDSPNFLARIGEILSAKRFKIFERIQIEIITRHLDVDKTTVAPKLTDRELFDDPGVPEYNTLAEKGFNLLNDSEQEKILQWVNEGLDRALLQERAGLSAEQADAQIEYWRFLRLAPIRDYLPNPWRIRFEALEHKFGSPSRPAHAVVSGGAFSMSSSKSPQQQADLEAMTVEDILQYIRSWRPPNDPTVPFGPSEEGLGAVLSSVVHQRATEFSEHSSGFKDADPTYVRAAIQGFVSAAREKSPFDWSQVLNLCLWTVSQPIEIPGRTGDHWTRDPDWRWARNAVIDLVEEGFKQKAIRIDLRSVLWSVLEALSEGDDEQEDLCYDDEDSQDRDIWTSSINRTKPRAIRAVVKYIEWYRDIAGPKGLSLRGTPEAASLLQRHLDPAFDPSLDVRLIYGEFLPFLLNIDPYWVGDHIDRIIPEGQTLQSLRDVAWGAYLIANPAYDVAFDFLRRFYSSAIDEIGRPRMAGRGHMLADSDGNLAHHLMQLYWRGRISLDPGELLDCFYARANDDLLGQTTTYVGRSISDTKEGIPKEILDRLKRLWSRRLEQVTDKQHVREMAAYGWWFNSGYFEDEWALDHLQQSLQRSNGAMEPKLGTLERLVRLAEKYPSTVIDCTDMIVRAEPIDVILWVEDLKRILSIVIRVGDADASKRARSLIQSLGVRGYHEYRELLEQH
jgi:hypothetical protein